MSDTVAVDESLKAARTEIDEQLRINSEQAGRLAGQKAKVDKEKKEEVQSKMEDLRTKNIELRETWLNNVARILDIAGLIGVLQEQTKRMKKEAEVIGGIVTMLKTADSLLGITDGTIKLIGEAPKK
jgi:hypothetical protein